MSGLKGIAKNLTANFGSHAVAVLQQVALTPLFIREYGAAGFGEWLTLSAAVSYLGTLDFGIQTFVNQDLTVRYHRGDMEGFHVQQSTALRMLLGIVTVVGLLCAWTAAGGGRRSTPQWCGRPFWCWRCSCSQASSLDFLPVSFWS
jgi:O-antigen/teichoic acid export membrane protein